jgi:HEPN domain-containing protein
MQQCAEKYLKARLEEANISVPKIHNSPNLLTLVLPIEPSWDVLQSDLRMLNDYAVDIRYPGKSAVKADAKAAIGHCRVVREAARQSFGLPV